MAAARSLDMGVIADVIFTVTIVTVASGAIAEFQIRMGNVSSAADGAAVGIRCLRCGSGSLIRTGVERDGSGTGVLCYGIFCALGRSAGIDPPGLGKYIQNISAEEQEVVGQGNHAEEIVGEGSGKEIQCDNYQIQQSENPGLYGNDKE